MGALTPRYSAPAPIGPGHALSDFTSGNAVLDDWLRYTALRAEGQSARTYVTCEASDVVGYYALATGGVARGEAPGAIRRNMPDPVPVVIIARLAVDHHHQGRGLGSALLRDGLSRALALSEIAGCRAVLVHAIDDAARAYYAKHGFAEHPGGSRTMILAVDRLSRSL